MLHSICCLNVFERQKQPNGYRRWALAAVLYEPIFIIKSALKSVARSPPGQFAKSLKQLGDESKKKIAKKG